MGKLHLVVVNLFVEYVNQNKLKREGCGHDFLECLTGSCKFNQFVDRRKPHRTLTGDGCVF